MTTAATKGKPKVVPPQLYTGAEVCDFRPAWVGVPAGVVPMLEACYAADPDDLTPQLVLADLLAEHDDSREKWVRTGVRLWEACGRLKPGRKKWDYQQAKAELGPVCQTPAGWRLAGLWGCLVAWHAPAGDGSERVMGRTWVDERVKVVNRSLWWWGLGFLSDFEQAYAAWGQAYAAGWQAYAAWGQADAAWSQADAAWSQAYAAWGQAEAAGRQAYAAGWQAYAAGRQAYAAGWQADAAGRQADAAGSQAEAAGRQAYAAGWQAYAAGRQADAAGRQAYAAGWQADAAGRQAYAAGRQAAVWRFARSAWDLCANELSALGGVQ